jgi:hypothetical protein
MYWWQSTWPATNLTPKGVSKDQSGLERCLVTNHTAIPAKKLVNKKSRKKNCASTNAATPEAQAAISAIAISSRRLLPIIHLMSAARDGLATDFNRLQPKLRQIGRLTPERGEIAGAQVVTLNCGGQKERAPEVARGSIVDHALLKNSDTGTMGVYG